MRAVLPWVGLLALAAGAQTLSGPLHSDETWTGTIPLTGDVTVPPGLTLRIRPGTQVRFPALADDRVAGDFNGTVRPNALTEIRVRGRLLAEGAVFDSTTGQPRTWGQIKLEGSGAGPSVITGCTIRNAVVGVTVTGFGGRSPLADQGLNAGDRDRAFGTEQDRITNNVLLENEAGIAIIFPGHTPVVRENRIQSLAVTGARGLLSCLSGAGGPIAHNAVRVAGPAVHQTGSDALPSNVVWDHNTLLGDGVFLGGLGAGGAGAQLFRNTIVADRDGNALPAGTTMDPHSPFRFDAPFGANPSARGFATASNACSIANSGQVFFIQPTLPPNPFEGFFGLVSWPLPHPGDFLALPAFASLDVTREHWLLPRNPLYLGTATDGTNLGATQGLCDLAPAVARPAGTAPRAVLAADLDRDGRDDLVAADEAGGRVAVLRNTGGGAFAAPVFFPAGARPVALVAATLDAGPTPDLAVADASGDAVVILLGDGAGGFLPGGSFPAGAAPEALAAADLDGDLDVDLAVVGAGRPVPPTPGTIRVLHNDGAANFAASTALPGAFLRPSAVVAADLDGDLDRDLAVADAGTATLLVYANAAGFGAPAPHAVGPEPRGVVAADLDRDGDPDLAVACLGLPGQPGSLAVLRGLPGIAFTPATFSAAGAALTSLAAADLGQDEDLDVAATDVASYRLRLQLSHSGTAFGPSTSCAAGTLPFHVAVGEWNQDFTPDLVVADPAAGTVQVLQAIPRPLAIRYGAGCGGTAGVPVLTAVGLPALGNFGFALTLTSARPLTGTMLLIALDRDDRPAGGGCRVLVGGNFSLLLNFTDGSGFSVTPLPVPADAILGGVNVYAQWAVFDPLGALGGTFALTGGLRLKLGFPYQ